jgi:hypothetical protein
MNGGGVAGAGGAPLRAVPLACAAVMILTASALAQSDLAAPADGNPPGATPQNDPAFLKKLEADPSFAGAEKPSKQPDATGSTTPGETRQYTPTKQFDEETQKPR